MKISSPIGPVSYPLIASQMKRHDFEILFNSENADAYVNASVELILKGLEVKYSLIKNMLIIFPSLGKRISVWKKGSANDLMLRAILKLLNKNSEIIYTDDPMQVYALYKRREADSALLTNSIDDLTTNNAKGIPIEQYFENFNIYMPGICGAYVNNNEEDFISIYQEGIDLFKENPEETAEYVSDNLPVFRGSIFIQKLMERSILKIEKTRNYDKFKEIIMNIRH
jgi:hypothetical protein